VKKKRHIKCKQFLANEVGFRGLASAFFGSAKNLNIQTIQKEQSFRWLLEKGAEMMA